VLAHSSDLRPLLVRRSNADQTSIRPRSGLDHPASRLPSAQIDATTPSPMKTTLRASGALSRSSSSRRLSGGRTSAARLPMAIAPPIARTSQARRSSPRNTLHDCPNHGPRPNGPNDPFGSDSIKGPSSEPILTSWAVSPSPTSRGRRGWDTPSSASPPALSRVLAHESCFRRSG
jgi:hypothetical protein